MYLLGTRVFFLRTHPIGELSLPVDNDKLDLHFLLVITHPTLDKTFNFCPPTRIFHGNCEIIAHGNAFGRDGSGARLPLEASFSVLGRCIELSDGCSLKSSEAEFAEFDEVCVLHNRGGTKHTTTRDGEFLLRDIEDLV